MVNDVFFTGLGYRIQMCIPQKKKSVIYVNYTSGSERVKHKNFLYVV